MHSLDFYLQTLASIHLSNLRQLAMMPTISNSVTDLVVPAIDAGNIEYAKNQLALYLHAMEQSGIDPSATDWFIWLPVSEIPNYFDPYFDNLSSRTKGDIEWIYRLTPRNKYRHALYTIRKQFPFSYSDYTWSSRNRLYKHLKSLGWYWEKGRQFGYWSNVCF